MTAPARLPLGVAVLCGVVLLAGCSDGGAVAEPAPSTGPTTVPTTAPATPATSPTTPSAAAPTPAPSTPPTETPTGPATSDGTPRTAYLSVPALGLRDLEVVPYVGQTDDTPGTVIQDRGVAASPHGPDGGTGPGGVGSFQVTAHRNTAGGPFSELPDLQVGERVQVRAGGTTYVYEITETRRTSFRSAASLRAQRAAVPGRPGVAPTQAMILLSTCLTQEDHAAGNYWSDENSNPEHRSDKIGVLVETRPG